jgi:hypothetical protein
MSIRVWAGILLVGLVLGIAIFGPRACASMKRKLADQKVNTARAEGQVKAASDATVITADALTNAAATDDQTRSNEREIRAAPGADTPVAADTNSAGIRALCLRPTYRDKPRCVAMLGPRTAAPKK